MSDLKYYYLLAVYTEDWEKYWADGHNFSEEIWAGMESFPQDEAMLSGIDYWSFPMADAKKHPQLKVKTDPTLIFFIQPNGTEYVEGEKLQPVAKLVGEQINRRNIKFMMENVLKLEYNPEGGGFYNPAIGKDSIVGYGQTEDAPGGSLFGLLALNPMSYEIFIDKPNLLEKIWSFLFGSKIKEPGSGGGGSTIFIIILVLLIIVGIWFWVKKKGGTSINIFTSKMATT